MQKVEIRTLKTQHITSRQDTLKHIYIKEQ